MRIYDVCGARPKKLSKFDVKTGWYISQDVLIELLPGETVDEVKQAMRS